MKDDVERRLVFQQIDEFLRTNSFTKNISREDRITKLSKPLTVIALNIVKRNK